MDSERLPTERLELEPDLAPGMEPEEGALTRRSIKYTPGQQDATIPAGWKPSLNKPIPVVRCHYVWKTGHPREGDRCNKWSLRGSQLCFFHSGRGNLKNVEEYRLAIIEAARLQLTEAVPDAMKTLLDLAANSPADNVKLKAATEILDRAGIKTAAELNVNVEVTEANPATTLAERLDKLRRGAEAAAASAAAQQATIEAALELTAATPSAEDDDALVIEGEVIGDPSDTAAPDEDA
jgi:hypothetical protein